MSRSAPLALLVLVLLVAGIALPNSFANVLLAVGGAVALVLLVTVLRVDALVAALFSAVCLTGWFVAAAA